MAKFEINVTIDGEIEADEIGPATLEVNEALDAVAPSLRKFGLRVRSIYIDEKAEKQ
jgi:hypothetical protein